MSETSPHTSEVSEAIEHLSTRPLGSVKVMMVEDDPIITGLVTAQLSREGCVPYSTLYSDEAIHLAENFQPHVIILDLMMPTLSGEELLTTLKQHPSLKHIPVIVYTNKGEEIDQSNVLALGASAYFVKASTNIKDLVEAVKRLALK